MNSKLFADDTQFYYVVTDIVNMNKKVSEVLTCVGQWMEQKQLQLSTEKTEYASGKVR